MLRVDTVAGVDLDDTHLVRGERAGLVGRDHARAPQRLHGRQTAHERVLAGHATHADGERERRNCGKSFGDDRHRERNRHLDDLAHLEAAHPTQPGQREPKPDDDERQAATQTFQSRLQRCLHGVGCGGEVGDATDLGLGAGSDHDTATTTGSDGRTGVEHPDTLGECGVSRHRIDRLVHGFALTGERRFLNLEVAYLDETDIGRNPVACLHCDDVAGDEIDRVDLVAAVVAFDVGHTARQPLQRLHRSNRSQLGDESHQCVDQQRNGHCSRLDELTDRDPSHHCGGEEDDHGAADLVPQDRPSRQLPALLERVAPDGSTTTHDLGRVEADGLVDAKTLEHLRCIECVRSVDHQLDGRPRRRASQRVQGATGRRAHLAPQLRGRLPFRRRQQHRGLRSVTEHRTRQSLAQSTSTLRGPCCSAGIHSPLAHQLMDVGMRRPK